MPTLNTFGSARGFGRAGAAKPNQVTGLTATNVGSGRAYNNGRIDIAWSAPANNGAPITGYFIERSTNSGSTWSTLVANTGSASVSYSDTGLTSAQRYDYRVSAINAVGTGDASAAANATATTVPQAPTIGTATAGSGSASVTFTANATGGSAITGYTVTSSPGSLTGTGAASPVTVSGLTNGTSYTFTATATNANGTSTASAASNSVIPEAYWLLDLTGLNTQQAGSLRSVSSGDFNAFHNYLTTNGVQILRYNNSGTLSSQSTYTLTNSAPGSPAIDSSQNAHLCGQFTTGGNNYPFISKLNSSGSILWEKRVENGNTNYYNQAYVVRLDSSGNPHIVFNNNNAYTPNIMKLNTSGGITWQKSFTTSSNTYNLTQDMSIDSSGNIYIAAQNNGTQNSNSNASLTKFDSSGNFQWQKMYGAYENGGSGVQSPKVVASTSGYVYLAYQYNYYVYVIKLDSAGNFVWRKAITGGMYNNQISSMVVDSSDNIYTAGYYTQNEPAGESWNYGWVVKMDSNGTMSWSRNITNGRARLNTTETYVASLALSGSNSLLVSGYCAPTTGTQYRAFTLKVPTDGTKTGTYSVDDLSFTWANNSSFKYVLPTLPFEPTIWTLSVSTGTPTYTLSNISGSVTTPSYSRSIVNI